MEETRRAIERSPLWHKIFEKVDEISLANQGSGDCVDKPSLTTTLEELFKSTEVDNIKSLIDQYIKEELPDSDVPFHYNSEAATGMKFFKRWLEDKQTK